MTSFSFKIGVVHRGAYSASNTYQVNDEVSYNGSSYRCVIANTTGVVPTDVSRWVVVSSKGDTGPAGATGPTGATGATGPQGVAGQGFQIETIFNSLSALLAGSVTDGKFGLVAGTLSQSDPDYGKLYFRNAGAWQYITDMSVPGAAGVQGPAGATGAAMTNVAYNASTGVFSFDVA